MNKVIRELLDKNGVKYALFQETWFHIQKFHPEIRRFDILEEVLMTPDIVMRSKWDPHGLLYCKKKGKYYKVVVVSIKEKRVKTTLTERKITGGDVIWKRVEN